MTSPRTARHIPLLRNTPIKARLEKGRLFPVTLTAGQQLKISAGRPVQAHIVPELEVGANTHVTLDYAGIDSLAR